jgi:hypothetical protein
MKLFVERFTSNKDATVSTIYLDDVFQCFGLEDEYREEKVALETLIPAGSYKGMTSHYRRFSCSIRKKFSDTHQEVLHVQKVPGFEFILIHFGNADENTAGCLLVGTGARAGEGDMSIQSSHVAYKKLYSKVFKAAKKENLEIEYFDRYRTVDNDLKK